ncbi:hypothetical protein PF010_g33254, partial [Phytophthora fragariae]
MVVPALVLIHVLYPFVGATCFRFHWSQGSASVATPSVVGPVPPSAGPSSEDARLSSAGPPPRVASSPVGLGSADAPTFSASL